MSKTIQVEIAYALPQKQRILKVEIPEDASAKDAVIKSGIVDEFPEIDPETAKLGVFGKLLRGAVKLRAGDRIEIYRPLIADPKADRKKRASANAEKAKATKAQAADAKSSDDKVKDEAAKPPVVE